MSEAPFFSVICPTHNGADRLDRSLSSVRSQRFKDYELIVVCDACTDNSDVIASRYDATVIRTDYAADGLARNAGMQVATGQWILFIDDDDWFLHEYVFTMLSEVAGKQGEDVLCFSFIWKKIGYAKQSPDNLYVMCWCKCYRRDFLDGVRFTGKTYASDVDFYHSVMDKKPNIVFWNTPMYYYNYMREGSLTQTMEEGESSE